MRTSVATETVAEYPDPWLHFPKISGLEEKCHTVQLSADLPDTLQTCVTGFPGT